MQRYLVTGTDTDVGKTRLTAIVARTLLDAQLRPTVVKLVQTGAENGEPDDAERAGKLARCPYRTLERFAKPADPWSAALAQNRPPVRADALARSLDGIEGTIVAEGAGGLAVPLNRDQHFGTVAQMAGLRIILAVGLRLGCMNHALLTLSLCDRLRLDVAGAVLVDRFARSEQSYIDDVRRVLQGKIEILGILPFEPNEALAVAADTPLSTLF
ncbi:MAG: dethiobiotin synthase [Candidatus Eremiobacteraeota bacterium]|nr:dethiobiotin synthase [Candidatus Eremiobacteraeota bacterium]